MSKKKKELGSFFPNDIYFELVEETKSEEKELNITISQLSVMPENVCVSWDHMMKAAKHFYDHDGELNPALTWREFDMYWKYLSLKKGKGDTTDTKKPLKPVKEYFIDSIAFCLTLMQFTVKVGYRYDTGFFSLVLDTSSSIRR